MLPTTPTPPVASREPYVTRIHDLELTDDYAWLRLKHKPEVTAYLEAENAYTAAAMAGTEPLQAQLYNEILSHIKEDDTSFPYRDGAWEYFVRTETGKQYPTYLRRPAAQPDAAEMVVLDVNLLAEGKAYMSVGSMAVSTSGRLLAYTTDETGFRQYTLHFKDLQDGVDDFGATAERVGSIVWATGEPVLYFTTEDEQTKRQDSVFRIGLFGEPELLYHEPDERFSVGLGRTRDRSYILLDISSHTTSETRFLYARDPESTFQLLAPRVDDQEYHVDHRDGYFYIHTNMGAERFRLMRTPVHSLKRQHWQELIAEDPSAPLEDVDLFQNFLVATRREGGLPVLHVYTLDTAGIPENPAPIRFPDPAYSASGDVNRDFHTTRYRYAYQSLVRPASIFEYDTNTRESTLLRQQEVPGGFDAGLYESQRLGFTATDGTSIPVSVVYRRDKFHHDGKAPLYLYGYGSYGYALPLGFSAARLALLDRGIVVAYAHIRGGGEMGDPWHDAGKMLRKQNTFTDFIEAAEDLVARNFVDPAKIAIEGGSAGGLLMGAVVNMRPDLFRAVLSHVPFVDVVNTMLDASLPLTVGEYEEWGNPNHREYFDYIRSYSPYDNLDALAGKPLPAMLIKTSLNDSQVMYWEPAKYVARLRTLKTDATPLLLHINMEAGHGGASGRYDYLKEIAFDYAFLLRQLGLA